VFAVRNLIGDRLLVEAARQVLLDGRLLGGVRGHNGILAAGVARRAVGIENELATLRGGAQAQTGPGRDWAHEHERLRAGRHAREAQGHEKQAAHHGVRRVALLI